ncbi:MAG: nuclear transport factor 2 family protein [Acidimicrobiales bacterium]
MDWQAWAGKVEQTEGTDAFASLFATGGQFRDPVTPWTTDVRKVSDQTNAIFPDWKQRIDTIRGGDDWAVWEWTGTATFFPAGPDGQGIPIAMEGATVVEVDAAGLVTRWRDYLDTNEPMQQIERGMAATGDGAPASGRRDGGEGFGGEGGA